MRKEEAILKVNKLGKVSNIIVRICKIFVILGLVFLIVGTIITAIIPKGFLSIDMGATADVNMDFAVFEEFMTADEKEDFIETFHEDLQGDGDFKMTMGLNGAQYEYDGLAMSLDGLLLSMSGVMEEYTIELSDFIVVFVMGLVSMIALYVTLVYAGRLSRAFRDCQSPFEEIVVKSLKRLAFSLIPWVVMNSVEESVSESIFNNNMQVVLGVDLGVLVIIFFIFIIAYIFQYGAVLQQESDETL